MDNDRELLELAAKAAGINAVARYAFGDGPVEECKLGLFNLDKGGIFNPLTDDGDAMRLAVKLGLMVDIDYVDAKAYAWAVEVHPRDEEGCAEAIGESPYAATRRAIVRAAAELGRSK